MKLNNYILVLFFIWCGYTLTAQEEPVSPREKTQVTIKSGYWEKKPDVPDAVIYTRDKSGQVYIRRRKYAALHRGRRRKKSVLSVSPAIKAAQSNPTCHLGKTELIHLVSGKTVK